MTLDEIADEILIRLNEDLANPVSTTRAAVYKAVQRGYECISEATEWHEQVVSHPLCSRRTYYDLRAFRVQVLTIRHIYNLQTQRWLRPGAYEDLDLSYRHWQFIQGSPELWLIRGLNWLGIWPWSNVDFGNLRIACRTMPKPLTRPEDSPGFDDDLHEALVEYGFYEIKLDDRETKAAIKAYGAYLEYEDTLRMRVDTRQKVDKMYSLGEP